MTAKLKTYETLVSVMFCIFNRGTWANLSLIAKVLEDQYRTVELLAGCVCEWSLKLNIETRLLALLLDGDIHRSHEA